jgi:large subunit ribosomal protein L3
MTHIKCVDTRPGSPTQNKSVTIPVTVLDAPSLHVVAMRFYKKTPKGLLSVGEKWADNIPKDLHLQRKTMPAKKAAVSEGATEVQIVVATQPRKSGMDKLKPDVLEMGIGGKPAEKSKVAESLLGKEISAKDIFKPGEWIDVTGVTRGRGFEGPVTRYGVRIQSRKDKQRQRKPGSIGGTTPRKVSWRVAQAGQFGFFTRTEFNKRLVAIGDDPKAVNPKGGFLGYGVIPQNFLLIEGSVPGPAKRLVVLRKSFRPHPKEVQILPAYISTESKQGL